jgi:hypothetical protein
MRTSRKLALAFALLVASILLLRFNGWFGLGILVALPLVILWWFDLGSELRSSPSPSRLVRVGGLLMGLPQAVFGLVCLVAGLSLICWVLYNTFWEIHPFYTGGFLTFGLGPLLALFGLGLLFDAFSRA